MARSVRVLFVCLACFSGLCLRPPRLEAITFTEIMYHPAGDAESVNLEWIELYNETPVTLNLSGYYFSNGIDFVFPHDTYLPAYSYLVVCADESAVRAAYGIDNTIGNFEGRLDNGGETIELSIFGGGPEVRVEFSDRGQWPHAADGTGHSLALKGVFMDPADNDSWTASFVMGGTPGRPNLDEPQVADTIILEDDHLWSYRKGTSPYPEGWRDIGFDDGDWEVGRTGIGYDDEDDRTELLDMRNGYISFAARTTIYLSEEELGEIDKLVLQLSYDDGFVAYLNGREVARGAMSQAGSPVAYDAAADLHDAGAFEDFILPTTLLAVGENVLAVQIHNTTIGSSDASFIPRLLRRRLLVPTPAREPVPVVINEFFGRTDESRWVELYNTSRAAVDLAGFHLSTDRNALDGWSLPAGTVLPAGGYYSVTDEEAGLDFSGETTSVFLSTPDLEAVVDAQVFDNDPELHGTSEARYPDGGRRFFVSSSPTPYGANEVNQETDVVINELMYNRPENRFDLEFIELYNRGTLDLDIGGFRFTRGVDFTFPPGTELSAGEYLVVGKDPEALAAAHELTGVYGPYEGALDNDGELVRLVDRAGNIVDEVRYHDSGAWEHWADGGGSSLELIDASQDNAVGSAWAASDERAKAGWEELRFTIDDYIEQRESEVHVMLLGAGEALLDEIRLRRFNAQLVPDPGFETETEHWIIEGNHIQSHRTTDDRFAGETCLRIVATGDGDTRVNRIETETSSVMTSGSGYVLTCAVKWQRGANLIYFGNYNQLPGFQFTHWMRYPRNLGTPGARNSVSTGNLGPVISDAMHSPAVPSGGEPVRIVARVSDSDGVDRVRAFYRAGSANGVFSFVDLHDDGAHGDGGRADGLYGGTIPEQGMGTRVVYYVEARDQLGNRGRLPVDPARTHVYLHDSPLAARSFTARLIHDEAAWNELWSRRLHSNELLDATFIFNESEVYYNVGSRFRGSPWNRPPEVRMYRVTFPKDRLLLGRRAINLSRYGSEHDERTAYYSVWRNSTPTIPCPMSRGSFARVKTNDRIDTMELVEPVNRDYARLWFPQDSQGTFYKVGGKLLFNDEGSRVDPIQWASYRYRGPDVGEYRWFFNHRTNEMEHDFSPVIAMLEAVNGSDAVLDHELADIMDVEQFLRVYAARCAHDDWDTIAIGNGQNAYFYWAPREGRMKLIPWDMDHSWGNTDARVFPDADRWFERIVSRPRWRRVYLGVLREMVDARGGSPGYWSTEELVTKFVDRNHDVVGADGVSSSSATKIRNFVSQRRSRLVAQVPETREFAITTNGGDDFVTDAVAAELAGEAWIDVQTITLAGEALDVEWTTELEWRAEIPLDGDENELLLFALDVDGNVVGSDAIAITSTIGWNKPTVTSVVPGAARPGHVIVVRGTDFHEGVGVLFNGTPSPHVVFDPGGDPTTIQVEVPDIPEGVARLSVINVDGRFSEPLSFTVISTPPRFIRGDFNLDGIVEVADAVRILLHLFRGLAVTCEDAGDFDDDEVLSAADALQLLDFVYGEGQPPVAPYPRPGWESEDEGPLDCRAGL